VEQPKAPPPLAWEVLPLWTLELGVSYRLNPEARELAPSFDSVVGAHAFAPTTAFRLGLELTAGYAYAAYAFESTHFFQAGGGATIGSSDFAVGWLPRFLIGTSGGQVTAGMRNTLVVCILDCVLPFQLSYDRLWLTGPPREDLRLHDRRRPRIRYQGDKPRRRTRLMPAIESGPSKGPEPPAMVRAEQSSATPHAQFREP
jgi:hypothetical protein